MDLQFQGRRVLITEVGSSGGSELARLMSRCGADVVAVSQTWADVMVLAEEIRCQSIVATLNDVETAYEVAERAGDFDLLVNNAEFSLPQTFLEATVEAFTQTMAVNVQAAMLIAQSMARRLIERREQGAIVNVLPQPSLAAGTDHVVFRMAEMALDQLTQAMAIELAPHGIRVNSVNPTDIPVLEVAWRDDLVSRRSEYEAKAKETAQTIAYLLSEQSAMIHGAMIPVDGHLI